VTEPPQATRGAGDDRRSSRDAQRRSYPGDVRAGGGDAPPGVIALRVRELPQFFDVLDPSPPEDKDLDPKAEEWLFESARETPRAAPCRIEVHVDAPPTLDDPDATVTRAVRGHFDRRSERLRRNRRDLLRRGVVSLGIAVAFLAATFGLGQVVRRMLGETGWPVLLREGLAIAGWVAMWRPLEIFLYGWWPILGEERICRRLAQADVRVRVRGVSGAPGARDAPGDVPTPSSPPA
jgi:hypothetical protein